jgi:hypothetical protein
MHHRFMTPRGAHYTDMKPISVRRRTGRQDCRYNVQKKMLMELKMMIKLHKERMTQNGLKMVGDQLNGRAQRQQMQQCYHEVGHERVGEANQESDGYSFEQQTLNVCLAHCQGARGEWPSRPTYEKGLQKGGPLLAKRENDVRC